ncbi:LysR family transcriptional regulator [Roseibium algae]|uniref:LysR family transcriptional regulator n=1 Tax=Roseibium algae TaxID=3123038 RepID=A0ABU8TSU6_9HYPH
MKSMPWDLYQHFLVVARNGGLSAAAILTGVSAATLGRRMLELERGLGRDLFRRSQTGYELTADGDDLLEHLKDLELAACKVDAWQGASKGDDVVRIAVGTWIGQLISKNVQAIRTPQDNFCIDLTIGEQRANLAFRENDIGIRSFAPEEPNLATRALGNVAYAAYKARNSPQTPQDVWIGIHPEQAISAYLRWPHEHHGEKIQVTVNRPSALLDLALAGAGVAVIPCFVGDLEPGLERVVADIPELRHQQWIVMNNDDRHLPKIRTVVGRLTRLLQSHSNVVAGHKPRS